MRNLQVQMPRKEEQPGWPREPEGGREPGGVWTGGGLEPWPCTRRPEGGRRSAGSWAPQKALTPPTGGRG